MRRDPHSRPRQSYIRRRSTVCMNYTNASKINPPSHLARLHGGPKYIYLSHSYKYTRRWLASPHVFEAGINQWNES